MSFRRISINSGAPNGAPRGRVYRCLRPLATPGQVAPARWREAELARLIVRPVAYARNARAWSNPEETAASGRKRARRVTEGGCRGRRGGVVSRR